MVIEFKPYKSSVQSYGEELLLIDYDESVRKYVAIDENFDEFLFDDKFFSELYEESYMEFEPNIETINISMLRWLDKINNNMKDVLEAPHDKEYKDELFEMYKNKISDLMTFIDTWKVVCEV